MSSDNVRIGARLRAMREAPDRRWSRAEMARRLRAAADEQTRRQLPGPDSLIQMIKAWEKGKNGLSTRYWVLYARAFGVGEGELLGTPGDAEKPLTVDLLAVRLPNGNGRPADSAYVEQIRETNQTLVKLDSMYGGNDVFPLALRMFRSAHHKLATGAHEPSVQRDLEAATGETGEIAAWLAYDADLQDTSRQLAHEAMMLSRLAGDRSMELFELSHLAMQSVYLHRPAEALRIADTALDTGELPPRVRALFDIRRGRALAQLDDKAGAFDALDKARSALTEGITARDPYWAWWVDDAETAWHQGMAHAEAGDWKAAIPLLRDSADLISGSRRARHLMYLLEVLVHVQDWSDIEPIVTQIAGQADEIGSARLTNLLLRITGRIERAGEAPSTVADAAVELRKYLTEASGPLR